MLRWSAAAALLLAAILVPFFGFGSSLDAWTFARLDGAGGWSVPALVVGLLAGDLFLPVPSSFVSTAAGAQLGLLAGFLASWAGMSLGCWVGYEVGARVGRPGLEGWVGRAALSRFDVLLRRFGAPSLALARAVPVLAEASVLVAGASALPRRLFMTVVGLSNAGISAIYASAGASAVGAGSFGVAFAAALALPMLGYGIAAVVGRPARAEVSVHEVGQLEP